MEITKRETACDHPVRTVVINNPADDVEKFGFHPIEWPKGMVVSKAALRVPDG